LLILPIKRKWFDMIVSGEKKEEYRELKEYWHKRFTKADLGYICPLGFVGRNPREVMFRNGYSKNSLSCICLVKLTIGKGRPEWGAEPDKDYFILKILEVKEVKAQGI